MTSAFVWLFALGPVAITATAFGPATAARTRVAAVHRRSFAAAIFALAIACCSAICVATFGTVRSPLLGIAGIGIDLYIDALGATMFCLVSFVGSIVIAYSRNYMDGDPAHARFTRRLCLTLAAVLFLVVSGNLFMLTLAWIATSLALNRLLLFYPDRPRAAMAARKKFVASRISDACLIVALVLLYGTFGSLDYAELFPGMHALSAGPALSAPLQVAAVALVCAALLKSAQFPLFGWLVEVMETPTPVSALLHAGIINAGGFLMLRFSSVISPSLPALELLAIVGGFTALFGSVVMLTQTSIKVTLAYSTVAQMGFMMLECGLGAFPAALLHIVAHSLYKAHAFLSSGSVIDIARASWTPSPGGKPHPGRQFIAVAGVLTVALVVGRAFGVSPLEVPGAFALGCVVLLGLVHLVSSGIDERPNAYVLGRTILAACAVGVLYFALQAGMARLYSATLPVEGALHGPFAAAIVGVVVVSFAVVTFLQGLVPGDGGGSRWQAAYAHISNGLYVNTLANRLVLQFWPPHVPTASPVAVSTRTRP